MLSSSKCHFTRAVWTPKGLGSFPLEQLHGKAAWDFLSRWSAPLCCRECSPPPPYPLDNLGRQIPLQSRRSGGLYPGHLTAQIRKYSWTQLGDLSPRMQTISERILLCKYSFKCKWSVSRILQISDKSGKGILQDTEAKPLSFLCDWFQDLKGLCSPVPRALLDSGFHPTEPGVVCPLTASSSLHMPPADRRRANARDLLEHPFSIPWAVPYYLPTPPVSNSPNVRIKTNICLTPTHFSTFTSMTQFNSLLCPGWGWVGGQRWGVGAGEV